MKRFGSEVFLVVWCLVPAAAMWGSEKHSFVTYLSWFSPRYNTSGYYDNYDFPILEISDDVLSDGALIGELELIAYGGWDAVAVDLLLHSQEDVLERLNFLRSFSSKVVDDRLDRGLAYLPFLEFRKDVAGRSVLKKFIEDMFDELGDDEGWYSVNGKKVIVFYGAKTSTGFWNQLEDDLSNVRSSMLWIFESSGIYEGVLGRVDESITDNIVDQADGLFNFGASALQRGAQFSQALKDRYGQSHPDLLIGASVWPGYLKVRDSGKNFVPHRGTDHLKAVWDVALSSDVDFVNYSTWNDFHESTTLMPSFNALSSRLELSKLYLSAFSGYEKPTDKVGEPEGILNYRKVVFEGETLFFDFLPLSENASLGEAVFVITLLDEAGNVIGVVTSGSFNLSILEPVKLEFSSVGNRATCKVVRVSAKLLFESGDTFAYENLPDIVVAPPMSYGDQLWYSVPLHRLAKDDAKVEVMISGERETGGVVEISAPPVVGYAVGETEGTYLASSKNGKLFRFMTPVGTIGGERHVIGVDRVVSYEETSDRYMSVSDFEDSEFYTGEDYYSALVAYPDGSYAYSPTVWVSRMREVRSLREEWSPLCGLDWNGEKEFVGRRGLLSFGELKPKRIDYGLGAFAFRIEETLSYEISNLNFSNDSWDLAAPTGLKLNTSSEIRHSEHNSSGFEMVFLLENKNKNLNLIEFAGGALIISVNEKREVIINGGGVLGETDSSEPLPIGPIHLVVNYENGIVDLLINGISIVSLRTNGNCLHSEFKIPMNNPEVNLDLFAISIYDKIVDARSHYGDWAKHPFWRSH